MIRRAVLAGLVGLGLGLAATPGFAQAVDDQNCQDFPTQAAAQSHLRGDPTDPDRLDPNQNGIACETTVYPQGSARDETAVVLREASPTTTATPVAGAAQVTTSTVPVTQTTGPGIIPATTSTTSTTIVTPQAFGRTGFSPTTLGLAIGLMLLGWRMKVGARVVPQPGPYDVLPRDTWKRRLLG